MTKWRMRFIEGDVPEMPERLTGDRCSGCLEDMSEKDVYGRCGDRVLCAFCADDEWRELSGEEKLELLGYRVVR